MIVGKGERRGGSGGSVGYKCENEVNVSVTEKKNPRRFCHENCNVDHHVMHTPTSCTPNRISTCQLQPTISNIMSHKDRIEAALADLESQEVPNYSMTAKKHGVVRTTLMRRFTGKTVSNHEANTESRQALNFAQEKVLLGHIHSWYTSHTSVSQELRGRDTWGLPWKELDYAIYTTPLSTFKNV